MKGLNEKFLLRSGWTWNRLRLCSTADHRFEFTPPNSRCERSQVMALHNKSNMMNSASSSPPCLPKVLPVKNACRTFHSSATSLRVRGHDLLGESLAYLGSAEAIPKIVLKAYGSTGFDVVNAIKNMDPTDDDVARSGGILHMCGSILVFPGACFLWNVKRPDDLTIESLAPVMIHQPKLDYLFIGSQRPLPPKKIKAIKQDLEKVLGNIVVEQLDLPNAMGTFNILNGEDRHVAAALILEQDEDDIEK